MGRTATTPKPSGSYMEFITDKIPGLVLGLPLDFTFKVNVAFSTFHSKPNALSKGKLSLDKSKSEVSLDHSYLGIEFMTSRLLLIHVVEQKPPLLSRLRSSCTRFVAVSTIEVEIKLSST